MITGIHHISMKCGTDDEFEKAKDFYLNILGLSATDRWERKLNFSGNNKIR